MQLKLPRVVKVNQSDVRFRLETLGRLAKTLNLKLDDYVLYKTDHPHRLARRRGLDKASQHDYEQEHGDNVQHLTESIRALDPSVKMVVSGPRRFSSTHVDQPVSQSSE